ncbi:MAG: DinB family protein [Acidimicrobiales bacterium]
MTTDEHGRTDPPEAGSETATLLGFLDYQRGTFGWKTSGLDGAQLARTIASSSMTLGGMMKHLALVEDYWFSQWLWGRDQAAPFGDADWDGDPDWEWHSAENDSPATLLSLWQGAVERSRIAVNEALVTGGVDQLARRSSEDGRVPSLRWILCHMIEEYARHNGHADLLREAIDGATGE